MIELYSQNITVTGNATISWQTKSTQVGNTATLNADGQTINLNQPGVYEVTVSSYGSTTAAGDFSYQLNGASQITRGATSTSTGAGDTASVGFSTLIGVSANLASTAKAALTLNYTGDAGSIDLVDIIVKKVL